MTDFTFTDPNGKNYKVTAPEGATKEEAFQRLQRKLAGMPDLPSQPTQQEPMGWGEVGLKALVNVPGSAYRMGRDIYQAVRHPVDTATGLGNVALGGLEKLGFPTTGHEQYADAVGQFFKERYGGLENIKHTLAEDPVGALGDFATALTGGGGLVARFPGTVGRLGQLAGTAGRVIDPINIAMKAGGAALKPLAGGTLAQRDVARALERDKMTPGEATSAGADIARERPGMQTLANVGGENVQGLVERVASTPGAGRTDLVPKLIEQQQGQAARIGNDLKSLTGTTRTAVKAVEDSVEAQRTTAAPLYKTAYGAGDKLIWNSDIERLTAAKDVQKAMRQAVHDWERTAVADGYGAMKWRAMVEGGGLIKFQKGGIPAYPNLQFFDYTKHALDRMISKEINPATGRMTRKGAELTTIKNKLVSILDKEVPEYARARAQYAGPAQYMSAINEGRSLRTRGLTAEEVRNAMKGYSESEREAYRTGVVSDIVQHLESNPAKLADYTRELRSKAMRDKIAAIMPTPELAEKWLKRLDLEVKSSEMVGRALKGSPTARRLAEMQDASMVGDLVMDAIKSRGSPSALAMKVVGAIPKYVRDKYRANADEAIARLLTSPGALEHLDLALKGGVPRREPFLHPDVGAAGQRIAPQSQTAFQAGRLVQLQNDAKEALKDKDRTFTTEQRQDLRAVSRGTATLAQRQRADSFLKRFEGTDASFEERFTGAGGGRQPLRITVTPADRPYGGPQ